LPKEINREQTEYRMTLKAISTEKKKEIYSNSIEEDIMISNEEPNNKPQGEKASVSEKYRSAPINVSGVGNSIRSSIQEPCDAKMSEERNATDATQQPKYQSSPIKMDGIRNSMLTSTTTIEEASTKEFDTKVVAEDKNTDSIPEHKYRGCPIKVQGLRNSLRSSIASKRSSMTHSELKFVQDMLEESLREDELESMQEVLKCDKTFFHHDKSKGQEDATADETELIRRASAPENVEVGSQKRQLYLEARKRQSEEQMRRRSKALWKKAACAAKMIAKLPKQKPLATKKEVVEKTEEESKPAIPRPVFLREASVNMYGGEGFEIGAEAFISEEEEKKESDDEEDSVEETKRTFSSLSTQSPRGEGYRRASVNIYGGEGFEIAEEGLFEQIYDGDSRRSYEDYDPWLFQETDKTGKRREFTILGTSHDDLECHPHVLSPVQMDRFQPFLPDTKKGESFWLKYSLVRDGASTISFLQQVRASPYTLLAMETVDGEVFGGFFASAWTVQPDYFGSGECFLWRMKHPRKLHEGEDSKSEGSLVEQIERESELEIFPSEVYYANNFFQMCLKDKIASGGGTTSLPKDFGEDRGGTYEPHEIGFGLQLGAYESLLQGSSSPSLTFRNPPLSKLHADGSTFELLNLEAWGFTPCQTEEEARILEYKNMFFRKHSRESIR